MEIEYLFLTSSSKYVLIPPIVIGYDFLIIFSNKSRTLPFETRKNVAAIALTPDSNVLIAVDDGESHGVLYIC